MLRPYAQQDCVVFRQQLMGFGADAHVDAAAELDPLGLHLTDTARDLFLLHLEVRDPEY